jgi:molecular chaperone HscB
MQMDDGKTSREGDAASAAKAPDVVSCWSCKGPVKAGEPFCDTCKAVQPPGQTDHFRRLGLDMTFDLNVAELDAKYFQMQRLLHPDRFATKGPKEKAFSQQQATALNDAYETLKDPLKRADYLLEVRGVDEMPEGCHLVNDQALLMESMELREALAEAGTLGDVDKVANRAKGDINVCLADLSGAFKDFDMERACYLATRLKYLTKLAEEARQRRARLGAAAMAL